MAKRRISARRLAWLRAELTDWQQQGLIGGDAAATIADGYVVSRRLPLERLAFLLGGVFLGIGAIWLVAANLELLSPLVRVAGISAVWVAMLAVAELLARREERSAEGGTTPGLEAAELIAVLAYGAVVFQAAQSLQVPAFSSALLGVWGLGALAYAYATGGIAPLIVAIATAVGWYGWVVGERSESGAAVAIALLIGGGIATAVAVVHEHGPWRSAPVPARLTRARFAGPWRQAGALLTLVGLFIVIVATGEVPTIWLGVAALLVAVGFAVAVGDRWGRAEVLAGPVLVAVAMLLAAWRPEAEGFGFDEVTGAQIAHALVSTAVYVLAATWFAAVGVFRETAYVTTLATSALVVFVVVQSFAVFEPLLSGAALFLTLGAILVASGMLASRGRRRLVGAVAEAAAER